MDPLCARHNVVQIARNNLNYHSRFGKPMSTRGKPLRRCAEHNVSSSTPAPVRVKALYTHHQLHTTIRGPSRAAAHSNFAADAGCLSSGSENSPRPPLRLPQSGPAVRRHLLYSTQSTVSGPDGTATSSSNSWTGGTQTTCTHGVT